MKKLLIFVLGVFAFTSAYADVIFPDKNSILQADKPIYEALTVRVTCKDEKQSDTEMIEVCTKRVGTEKNGFSCTRTPIGGGKFTFLCSVESPPITSELANQIWDVLPNTFQKNKDIKNGVETTAKVGNLSCVRTQTESFPVSGSKSLPTQQVKNPNIKSYQMATICNFTGFPVKKQQVNGDQKGSGGGESTIRGSQETKSRSNSSQ